MGAWRRNGQQMTPDEARKELAESLPDCVAMLAEIIHKPGRNAQTQLAAIKVILDRVGVPAVAATTITGSQGGPVEITLRLVKAKHESDPENHG